MRTTSTSMVPAPFTVSRCAVAYSSPPPHVLLLSPVWNGGGAKLAALRAPHARTERRHRSVVGPPIDVDGGFMAAVLAGHVEAVHAVAPHRGERHGLDRFGRAHRRAACSFAPAASTVWPPFGSPRARWQPRLRPPTLAWRQSCRCSNGTSTNAQQAAAVRAGVPRQSSSGGNFDSRCGQLRATMPQRQPGFSDRGGGAD